MSGVCLGPRGQENEGLILNGYRVSDLQDEKGGDSCTTMWLYLISLSYTFLNG